MPDRYHRVVYRSLPEGQEWAVVEIDGEQVIVISEALDEVARKRARKAARTSILGRGALLPLPVIAGAEWLRDRLQSPMSAAIVASTVTMTGAYAVAELTTDDPAIVAGPPVVVTVTPEATTAGPRPTLTRTPAARSERPTPRRESTRPALTGSAPTRAARTGQPTPARTTRPPAEDRAGDRRATRSAAPAEASAEVRAARTSGPPGTAGPRPTPTTAATTPPEVADDPPSASDPPASGPPALAGRDCGGIHVGLPLDPLLNLDVCLLD